MIGIIIFIHNRTINQDIPEAHLCANQASNAFHINGSTVFVNSWSNLHWKTSFGVVVCHDIQVVCQNVTQKNSMSKI